MLPLKRAFRTASSFNGAAPVKERKTRRRGGAVPAGPALQWGRSGEGAEDAMICGGQAAR